MKMQCNKTITEFDGTYFTEGRVYELHYNSAVEYVFMIDDMGDVHLVSWDFLADNFSKVGE